MQALANIEGIRILKTRLQFVQPGLRFLADRIRWSTSGKFTPNLVGTMQCVMKFAAAFASFQ